MSYNFIKSPITTAANSNSISKYSLIVSFLSVSYLKLYKNTSNNKLKSQEDPLETQIPQSPFDSEDDPEFEQLQQILNNPNIDPELYKQLMKESQNIGYQPLKFNQLHLWN